MQVHDDAQTNKASTSLELALNQSCGPIVMHDTHVHDVPVSIHESDVIRRLVTQSRGALHALGATAVSSTQAARQEAP
jgi:hypothetical protein